MSSSLKTCATGQEFPSALLTALYIVSKAVPGMQWALHKDLPNEGPLSLRRRIPTSSDTHIHTQPCYDPIFFILPLASDLHPNLSNLAPWKGPKPVPDFLIPRLVQMQVASPLSPHSPGALSWKRGREGRPPYDRGPPAQDPPRRHSHPQWTRAPR